MLPHTEIEENEKIEGEGLCSCENELTIVIVQCTLCGVPICPTCVISNDIPLCIYCSNDQRCVLNLKEDKCEHLEEGVYCNNAKAQEICISKGCGKKIKYCQNHSNKCGFCEKMMCLEHGKCCAEHKGKLCDWCSRKVKKRSPLMRKCDICDKYSCGTCCYNIFESKYTLAINANICRNHQIKCNKPTYAPCPDTYYPLKTNLCTFPGCENHGCKCCLFEVTEIRDIGIFMSARQACEKHIEICYYRGVGKNTCTRNYAKHHKGVIKWRRKGHEDVCMTCFSQFKGEIQTFMLVLLRLQIQMPHDIIEKIIEPQKLKVKPRY